MPLYLISHATDLSFPQQDKLAEGITKIHTELFFTPSLFVNVRFSPASNYLNYVGGKRSTVNSISAHVRHGPSRTPVMYDELTTTIAELWKEVVCPIYCTSQLFLLHLRFFSIGDFSSGANVDGIACGFRCQKIQLSVFLSCKFFLW
jgi:hypothetical protein